MIRTHPTDTQLPPRYAERSESLAASASPRIASLDAQRETAFSGSLPFSQDPQTPEPIVWYSEDISGVEIGEGDILEGDLPPSSFFVNRKPRTVQPGSFYAGDERADYTGRSFIQDSYPVPAPVHAALVSELAQRLEREPHTDEVRFTAHVWISGAFRRDESGRDLEGFVPIPFQVIARSVPDADPEALLFAGVLEMTPHSYSGGRSRAWAVSPDFGDVLDTALATSDPTASYVNVFTGKPTRGRKAGSRKTDDSRNPLSPTVILVMDSVPQGIINLPATEAHLERLRAAIDDATTDEARATAVGRYRNDALNVTWIKSRGLTATDAPGIYTYPHAWRDQSGGRIMPLKSGGAQSMSRAGKAAMYSGIASLRNYDLRASQPRILADEFRQMGIVCDWLDDYLADEDAKHVYAARVGVSVDTWKNALIAAMIGGGAAVPKSFEVQPVTRFVQRREVTTYRPVTGAMRTLEAEVGRKRAIELWPSLHAELKPLLRAVRKWQRKLKVWAKETATTGRDGRGITNAVGARLTLTGLTKRGQLARKVAAHVLQGREALYVHTLCIIAPSHGFSVVGHDHDGLQTLGDVPQAAMDEAARTAAMPYAEFVIKPFC